MKLSSLDKIIRAVCPVHGISSNGTISFKDSANQSQRDAATALMAQHFEALSIPESWSSQPLLTIVRAGREIALNRLMGIAFTANEDNDHDTVTACLVARASLLNITTLPSVLAATDDASLTAAIGAAYAAIVAAAPPSIVNAFAGIQS